MPLHPLIEKMMADARAVGKPALSDGSPEDLRKLMASGRAALGRGPEVGEVRDLRIPARSSGVPARLYRGISSKEHGLIVYAHGGGWVGGSLDDYDLLARALVDRSGCAVLSVDYRLAPEHRFPAGLHDVEDAIVWASTHVHELVDKRVPIVVAGDSAGANLSTVALAALQSEVNVALQCLFYPVTDTDLQRQSYRDFAEGLPLLARDMAWFMEQYAWPQERTDPRVAPLRGNRLHGLPPTWIATAEFDVLRDEGEEYARRLREAGVSVHLVRANGMAHGFIRWFNLVPEADAALTTAAQAMARACEAADAA